MGEKFAANPVTGTGSLTVPIPTSPARSGFGPQLQLSYDSGAGNGPFGFGWSLSLPSITRKTEKGLPQYHDEDESDVYLISGAEDLVPVLDADGARAKDDTSELGFTIHRYRPRVEGLFARIERWTDRATGEIHWRSITRENVTTLYGRDNQSRIFDPLDPNPAHPKRVFSWLICASYDDKGNAIAYEYAAEDDTRVDRMRVSERNRSRTANRYLKRVKYGNRESRLIQPDLTKMIWLFQVVFDYDEGHYAELPLSAARPADAQPTLVRASWQTDGAWGVRPDPFSSHRAGFEVRSYRRCHRVLLFHCFPELNQDRVAELGDEPCLVRAIELEYEDLDYSEGPTIDVERDHRGSTRFASFIQRMTPSGFVREASAVVNRGGVKYISYRKSSLPPLEFEYSKARIQDQVESLDEASAENLPVGVDNSNYQWVDLDGEGVSGVLTEQGGGWFYKPNTGNGRLGALRLLHSQPSLFALASGDTQLLDLSDDGRLDVVSFSDPTPGFYERTQEGGWESFRPFRHVPNLRWDDPNLRFVDLDGDGHADILITGDDVFTWYPSLAERGFGDARRVHQPTDEERGPRLVMDDGTQSMYLADLSGDGLTDLVRVRNGDVCYWPNLGYGRFGAKVTMDNAPRFDNPDQFDQRRIRLADVDGSGTTDILYLHRDGVRIYFNQSGNRWSEGRPLRAFPQVDNLSDIAMVDVLGNGTACLVWSSPLPGAARRPIRYVDLMGGQKPNLLIRTKNNLGAETRVEYASSSKFYLKDKAAGKPWVTRLPFPVHVVERVTTFDGISGNHFASSYAYHHGHFDGVEREFRGFGQVERWDTEAFAKFGAAAPAGSTNVDKGSHVPPVLTRTWFHTGCYIGRDHVSDFFAGLLGALDDGAYYREPGLTDDEARTRLLPDTILPPDMTYDEEREACRALKGMMLRQEVYALDADETSSPEEKARAATPFTVVEQSFTIEPLQARLGNRHAVFFTHPREVLTTHYERNPADPRVGHTLTLEVDEFGNVLKQATIAYGRVTSPLATTSDRDRQTTALLTYAENAVTNAIDSHDAHRAPLPCEAVTFELTGYHPTGPGGRFRAADFVEAMPNSPGRLRHIFKAPEVAYEAIAAGSQRRRRVEHVRIRYRKDDLSALLPLAGLEARALPGETYKLALTPSLVSQVFTRRDAGQPDEPLLPNPAPLLTGKGMDEGGYVADDGAWWIPCGEIFYDPDADIDDPALSAVAELKTAREHFFVPRKMTDAFRKATTVDYDTHDLLVTRVTDPAESSISAVHDYRVLQPREVTDPNRNRSRAAFDALGMPVATAVMGKPGEPVGDVLDGFTLDPTLAELRTFFADPQANALSLLGGATTRFLYDIDRYRRIRQPPFTATLARETHFEPARNHKTRIQIAFAFSDGFGREIQKKVQAEPGKAFQRQPPVTLPSGDEATGELVRDTQGKLAAPKHTPRRWVGSGRTVFNNKGKPVRQYEPFFSTTHLFESEVEMTDTGVSPVLFYDPVDRVVATLHPNRTYEKVTFDPWQQTTYDANDTCAPRKGETGDPRTDPHIRGYVARYFEGLPPATLAAWQTWHAQRIGGAAGPEELDAAKKAEGHADTPTTAHLDALGRTFLTVARSRVICSGHKLDGTEIELATRVALDIEGNQREVMDALDRVVVRYEYDLLGNAIHQVSMDAGERWTLGDAMGRPIRAWDSRRFLRRMTYDDLRRPTGLFVTEKGTERLAERTVYGEAMGDAGNHRGRIYQQFDAAGVVTHVTYDFKGNLRAHQRELIPAYKTSVNWLLYPAATDGTFKGSMTYDALNRVLSATSPDGSVYLPSFNEANLLEEVHVQLRGASAPTAFVTNVDYTAKGQREKIEYKNGATTTYEYDALTFRLSRLRTTRPTSGDATASQIFAAVSVVQDINYWYDAVGNITRVEDAALKTVVRSGETVEPVGAYTHDSVYRLIEARGREHIGQTAFDLVPPNGDCRDYPFAGNHAHPNDWKELRKYTERYEYDAVGNFAALVHRFATASWTRAYAYQSPSLTQAGKKNNRLTSTTVSGQGESYTYDEHGNMTSMPSLTSMAWDWKDQLQQCDLGGGGKVFYVYDSAGERLRKVIELQNGARQKERLYLGGFEIYREYKAGAVDLERESLHVADDKQRIALVETQTVKNGIKLQTLLPLTRYHLGNHLGSSSVELDDNGALVTYEEYRPYGTTSFQAGRSAAEVSLKRYRYTGKERDEETGLGYHSARYYAPWLGRWTSCDPAGLVDGTCVYAYVQNRPCLMKDPTGHNAMPDERQKQLEDRFQRYQQWAREHPIEADIYASVADDEYQRQEIAGMRGDGQLVWGTRRSVRLQEQHMRIANGDPRSHAFEQALVILSLGAAGVGLMARGSFQLRLANMSSYAPRSNPSLWVGRGVPDWLPPPTLSEPRMRLNMGPKFHDSLEFAPELFENKFPDHEIAPARQVFSVSQVRSGKFSRWLNYVVTRDGRLILGRRTSDPGGGHIDLARGEPVRVAGQVHIVDSQVKEIDNASGHYLPTGPSARQAAETAFRDAGMNPEGKYVEKVWRGGEWVPNN